MRQYSMLFGRQKSSWAHFGGLCRHCHVNRVKIWKQTHCLHSHIVRASHDSPDCPILSYFLLKEVNNFHQQNKVTTYCLLWISLFQAANWNHSVVGLLMWLTQAVAYEGNQPSSFFPRPFFLSRFSSRSSFLWLQCTIIVYFGDALASSLVYVLWVLQWAS